MCGQLLISDRVTAHGVIVDVGAWRDFKRTSSERGHGTKELRVILIQKRLVGRKECGCHNAELYLCLWKEFQGAGAYHGRGACVNTPPTGHQSIRVVTFGSCLVARRFWV